MQPGETHTQTLGRELLEECGVELAELGEPFGRVIEHNLPRETDLDVFRMTSYYYLCRIGTGRHPLQLDEYERALGFSPEWIDIDAAIAVNRLSLRIPADKPRYTERETFVLERVRRQIFGP
jgi:8-oxo-dGTP pyrophosphatase MutT (NUDIX family)